MASYTLNYGQGATNSLTVPDGQAETRANLTFPGRNFTGYGSPVDQNFLSLAEHFASSGSEGPINPVTGQLWFDTSSSNALAWKLRVNVANNASNAAWANIPQYDANTNNLSISGTLTTVNSTVTGTLTAGTGTIGGISLASSNISGITNLAATNANISGTVIVGNSTSNTTISSNTISTGNLTSRGFILGSNAATKIGTAPASIQFTAGDSSTADSIMMSGNITLNGASLGGGSAGGGALTTAGTMIVLGSNSNIHANAVASDLFGTGKTFGATTKFYPQSGLMMFDYTDATAPTQDVEHAAFMGKLGDAGVTSTTVSIPAEAFVLAKTISPTWTANVSAPGGYDTPTLIGGVTSFGEVYTGRLTAVNDTGSTANPSITAVAGNIEIDNLSTTSSFGIVSKNKAQGAIVFNPATGINIIPNQGANTANLITIATTGVTTVNSTASTGAASTSGALSVPRGGVYIGGNLRVAGKIFGSIELPTGSALTLPGLTVTGQSNMANANINNLTVSGNANIRHISTGGPTITGDITGNWTIFDSSVLNAANVRVTSSTANSTLFVYGDKNAASPTTATAVIEIAKIANTNTTLLTSSGIVQAGNFVVGRTYTITSVGTGTDFTLVGASSSTVGVKFVATGVGAGTGTAMTHGTIVGNWEFDSTSSLTVPTLTVTGTANMTAIRGNITSSNITTGSSSTAGSLTGTWTMTTGSALTAPTITATANAFFANANVTSTLTTRTITTGVATNASAAVMATLPGTITGAWKLVGNSTLQATYADLAERHHADAEYQVGTVMTVGGINEITAAQSGSTVLGVVSTDYAYLMNSEAGTQETHPAVAYLGRVPVRIIGPVKKHDRISPFSQGTAVASAENSFGWALETNDEQGEKLVLCLVK